MSEALQERYLNREKKQIQTNTLFKAKAPGEEFHFPEHNNISTYVRVCQGNYSDPHPFPLPH
jgi:hypothetical protein